MGFQTTRPPLKLQDREQNIDVPTSELHKWQFQNRDAELGELKKLAPEFRARQDKLVLLLYIPFYIGRTETALSFLKYEQSRSSSSDHTFRKFIR